jgi:FdhD protein
VRARTGDATLEPAVPGPEAARLDSALPTRHVTSTTVVTVRGADLEVRDDLVAGEEPLEIQAAGPRQKPVQVAVTMRTPGHENELAIGFLTSEGLLGDNDVTGVTYGDPAIKSQPDDSVLVHLRRRFDPSLAAKRNFVATASCGICGKASIDDVAVRSEPLPRGLPFVGRAVILGLPDMLRTAQSAFDRTGGLHAAGLFETDGRLVAVREDVGRHNALDKLIGSRVLARELPLWDRILMVSGRVSFEIVQKAAIAGIPIICAVSAPSDLAVRLADRLGVTLIGFLRGDSFNVYAHDNRIDLRDLLG